MSTEEKAKAYDEALKWMRELYPGLHGATKEDAEHYFPQLRESEDERIRKFLIDYFGIIKSTLSDGGIWKGFQIDEILAFLEKQKEQIPYTDFVIKPHKGDENNPYDMGVSEAQEYLIKRGFGVPFIDEEVYVDERHIIQTIGNIIRWADEHPKEQKPILKFKVGDKIHLIDGTSPNYEDDCITIGEIGTVNYFGEFKEGYVPIKEQDKWELVKEQKPSECLKAERDGWYMCIKDYYCGGKKQCAVGDLVHAKGGMYMMGEENISEWFRKAYYEEVRGAFEPNAETNISEQPSEWNEEDERRFISCMGRLQTADGAPTINSDWFEEHCYKHPSWKPSEEQMKILRKYVIGEWRDLTIGQDKILTSLYTDLEKLL